VIYSCNQSCIFSIITPVFSVTRPFRNHSNIWCSKNITVINVENSCSASYFCENHDAFVFRIIS